MGLWKLIKEDLGLGEPQTTPVDVGGVVINVPKASPFLSSGPGDQQAAPVKSEPVEPIIALVPVEQAPTIPEISPQEPRRATIRSSRAKAPYLSDESIAEIKKKEIANEAAKAEKARQRAIDRKARLKEVYEREKAELAAKRAERGLLPIGQQPTGNPAWVPGHSGNPIGRTKSKWFTDSLKSMLQADPELQKKFVKKCLDLAIKEGDIEFCKLLWDRLEGKQSAADENEASQAGPVQILFSGVEPRLSISTIEQPKLETNVLHNRVRE